MDRRDENPKLIFNESRVFLQIHSTRLEGQDAPGAPAK